MYFHRVFNSVAVYHDTEVCFVVEIRRAADVIQRRGFDCSVFILGHLCRVRHKDYQHVVQLCEVCQLVEQPGYVLRFVLTLALVFKPVVRVNNKSLYATPPDEELRPFKYRVKPVIVVWSDKEEVRFEVFLDLFVLPESEVLLVELLACELLYQLRGVVGEWCVFRAEISETPTVPHIQTLGYLVDELRLSAARYACNDTEAFRFKG